MNVRNYQKELEKILNEIEMHREESDEKVPTLFLHSCCAPCSSYVLQYLRRYFKITVFYYNPNISESGEYRKRVEEQKRLIEIYNGQISEGERYASGKEKQMIYPISIVEGDYEPAVFYDMARDYKDCLEGGERCFLCYELRLFKTARTALAGGFDYFGTTLTISPLKNAGKLNEIGEKLQEEFKIKWLPSDFKKKDGYKQSIALSAEYDLYRQDYCGCVYSRLEREKQKEKACQIVAK